MQVHVITVGRELLIGDVVNTNASWIGQFLTGQGLNCSRVVTIDDDAGEISREIGYSMERADLTILTGGLGPTHDDVTRQSLCAFFNTEMVDHEPTKRHIREMFEMRGIPLSSSNLSQSMVLSNCEVLFNKAGTAPGMYFRKNGRVLAVLPGVPSEMKYLMRHELMAKLAGEFNLKPCYYSRYFHIVGIGESTLSDLNIGNVTKFLNGRVSLAFLPDTRGVTLRLGSYADTPELAKKAAVPLEEHLRKTAGDYIFSDLPVDTLEAVVGRLLIEKKRTIAVAESCTGGLLGDKITNVSGSSAYYMGGMCTYSNRAKTELLGVDQKLLTENGAVSKPVALQMARAAAEKFNADIGISTTGIAGPDGGTPDKPVGTVWVGFWTREIHFAVKMTLFRDRLINKERSAIIALDILRRHLSGIERLPYDLKPEFA